jgi:hypothetical protein
MAHFELLAENKPRYEYYGDNVATVLNVAQRYSLNKADVYRDSEYLFTIQRNGVVKDFWIIHVNREVAAIRSWSEAEAGTSRSLPASHVSAPQP